MSRSPATGYVFEYEQRLLGAILHDSTRYDDVFAQLRSPKAFNAPQHALIFEVMTKLADSGGAIDVTTVSNELAISGNLERIGGRSYIAELAEQGIGANLDYYAGAVKSAHDRRILAGLSNEVSVAARDSSASNESIIDLIEKRLLSISTVHDHKFVDLGEEATKQAVAILSGESAIDRSRMIETRIADLNKFLGGGLYKGDLVVVAGPPSMGKSSFALDTCYFNTALGRNSLYCALDETTQTIAHRILSSETGLSRERLSYNDMTEDERTRITLAPARISQHKGKVKILGETNIRVSELRSHARRLHRLHHLDIIVIDYLGQLAAPLNIRQDNRTELVGENSRLLKALAKELDCLVIAVSQLNRGYASLEINPAEGKFGLPTQSMLRDSGQIEADANVILFPWRPLEALKKRGLGPGNAHYDTEVSKCGSDDIEDARIIVGKNKIGRTGLVAARFDGARMVFFSGDSQQNRTA